MKMRHLIGTVCAVALTVGACGTSESSTSMPSPEYTVTGTVTAGPFCPVVQNPPAAECADRPVDGAALVVLNAAQDQVAEVTSDTTGYFEVRLPAGSYTLVPQPVEGLLGTAGQQEFEVTAAPTDLLVSYDTGIR